MAATTATQPISIASSSSSQSHHYNNHHHSNSMWSSPPTSGSMASSMGIHQGPIFNAGSFNAGSFMSTASYGSKLFQDSPSQFIHPLDPNVYKCRVSSSVESDRAARILAMNFEIASKEEELCRNYNCCGLDITDLHALLEHFEEAHVLVFDSMANGHQPLSAVLEQFLPPPPPSASSSTSAASSDSSSALTTAAAASSTTTTSPTLTQHVDGMSGGINGGGEHEALDASDPATSSCSAHIASGPTPLGVRTSSDSALAGALGTQVAMPIPPSPSHLRTSFSAASSSSSASSSPSSTTMSATPLPNHVAQMQTPQPQQLRQHDTDMDFGMELDFDLDYDMQDSPPSGSGSDGSSPESEHAYAATAAMQQRQQYQHQQLRQTQQQTSFSTTTSAFSSPPDTPLLATPVSPAHSAFGAGAMNINTNTNGALNNNVGVWGVDGALNSPVSGMGMGMQQQLGIQSQMQQHQQQAKGPSAFDSIHVHLPPKNGLGRLGFPYQRQLQQHQQQQMFGVGHQHAAHPYLSAHLAHEQRRGSGGMYLASRNAGAAGLNGFGAAGSLSGALNSHGTYSTSEYARAIGLSAGNVNGVSSGLTGAATVKQEKPAAIPPSFLFGNGNGSMTSAWNTPMTTPAQSRSGSPTSGSGAVKKEGKSERSNCSATASSSHAKSSTTSASSPTSASKNSTASAPTTPISSTSPFLMQKPFKCPKPGCMKSYKQANGLKYHLTHGQCLYTPSAELLALSEEGLSEREAERKLRPFCCQVPPCQRRYKNMNGLRYHYQHSGEHGAVGLALLASGNHDATKCHPTPPQGSLELEAEDTLPLSPTTSNTTSSTTHQQNHLRLHNPQRTSPPLSAPPTPTTATAHRMLQLQRQKKFVFNNVAGMSQPPSAYASPYASRSGSPTSTQSQSQNIGGVPVPIYGGLTQQNMLFQQQQQQQQQQGAWM